MSDWNDTNLAFERVVCYILLNNLFLFFEPPFSLSEPGNFVLYKCNKGLCLSRSDKNLPINSFVREDCDPKR